MLTFEDALHKVEATVMPLATVHVPLASALGAVLAEPARAAEDSPPFDKSQMDGYAVRGSDLTVPVSMQVVGEVTAGGQFAGTVHPGQAVRIMTGAPLPAGTDTVVPFEWTSAADSQHVRIMQGSCQPGMFVIPRGNSYRSGSEVLSAGRRIGAREIAVLAELGASSVAVHRTPRVAILTTGDELVPIHERPGPAQIRNSNGCMLAAQIEGLGGQVVSLDHARDDQTELTARIQSGLSADLLCLTGGVSAGKLDLVPGILTALGVERVFHKIRLRPGKPLWFGQRPGSGTHGSNSCYIFGLPGNPVSSMVCAHLFVGTALRRMQGAIPAAPTPRRIPLGSALDFRDERTTFLPARVESTSHGLVVNPLDWQGSSDLAGAAQSNALAMFPYGEQHYSAGDLVDVYEW